MQHALREALNCRNFAKYTRAEGARQLPRHKSVQEGHLNPASRGRGCRVLGAKLARSHFIKGNQRPSSDWDARWPEAPTVPGKEGVARVQGVRTWSRCPVKTRAARPRPWSRFPGRRGPWSRACAGPPPTRAVPGRVLRHPSFYISACAPGLPRCELARLLDAEDLLLAPHIPQPRPACSAPLRSGPPSRSLSARRHASRAPRTLGGCAHRTHSAPRAAGGASRRGRGGRGPRSALRTVRRARAGPVRASAHRARVHGAGARTGLRLLLDLRAARRRRVRRLHRALWHRPPLPAAARGAVPAEGAAERPRVLRQRQRRRQPECLPALPTRSR